MYLYNVNLFLYCNFSGLKRYDFINGVWMYSYDGVSLYSFFLLEILNVFGYIVDFIVLLYGKLVDDKFMIVDVNYLLKKL